MKTKLLLFSVLLTIQTAFAVKIKYYEKLLDRVIIIDINFDSMAISTFPNNNLKILKVNVSELDILDEEQFNIAYIQLINNMFSISAGDTGKKIIIKQTELDELMKKSSFFYMEYLINRKSKKSNLNEGDDESGNNFDEQIRVTLGWNFNDMQNVPKGSFYGRVAFFTDEIYNRKSNIKKGKCDRPQVYGLYSGLFKQGYQIMETTPNTLFEARNITTIPRDSISLNRNYYSRDTVRTRLENYGFFFSPTISIWRTERIYDRETAVKKARNHYIWANVDFEYSVFKYIESYSDRLVTTRSKHLHKDSIIEYYDFSTPGTRKSRIISQTQYGVGLTYSFKSKTIEFIAKYSNGFRNIKSPDQSSGFYSNWYFCLSSKSNGFRLGGEIRSYILKSKSDLIYYNLFVGYAISLSKLSQLFKQ